MEKYLIHEANIERLEKKLQTIANKCAKYGCSFSYSKGEEVFKEVEDEDGTKHIAKFIEVFAEGTAITDLLELKNLRIFDDRYSWLFDSGK